MLWSALMSTTLVMEGYDGKVLGSLYAQPTFQKHTGIFRGNSPIRTQLQGRQDLTMLQA
jgi:hypothetical protein